MNTKRFAAPSAVAMLAFSGFAHTASLPQTPAVPVTAHLRGADTSDVPLPGALWLFGSALLVFVGISARRKF